MQMDWELAEGLKNMNDVLMVAFATGEASCILPELETLY